MKKESFKIFDAIASRYDFVNTVLSLGMHRGWRAALREKVVDGPREAPLKVLDLATGTGDVALALAEDARIGRVIGLDLSEGMLEVGRRKVAAASLDSRVTLQHGDAMHIQQEGFDAATMAFGIRNVRDPLECLRQIHNSLHPGGRVVILEFGLPRVRWFRVLHLFYLRCILPHLGRALTGHQFAYRYLNETIETFPYGAGFTGLMEQAGFAETGFQPLTMGVVHLYWGARR
jgi:demethylmenaquinone methyltransferase/2-methoxy-6-polyprenyl-1,4-benzoquinol methylase